MDQPTTLVHRHFPRATHRPRRRLAPAVCPLESRRLLTGSPSASATMTQTATFPDLEGHPGLSDQAILYFAATMGTLTEVDLVTSGSFTSRFAAENLAPAARTIAGTTAAELSIAVPTGPIPVVIPAVTQSFNASAFDGVLDDGGTSGRTFDPVTSSSATTTTVLTSPADLAAFTGHFRIPIAVSGHASEVTSPDDGEVSTSCATDTSTTITVIYHYIPNLPDPGQPSTGPTSQPEGPASPSSGTTGGTTAAPTSSVGAVTNASGVQADPTRMSVLPAQSGKGGTRGTRASSHAAHSRHHVARQPGASHRQGPGPSTGRARREGHAITIAASAAPSHPGPPA